MKLGVKYTSKDKYYGMVQAQEMDCHLNRQQMNQKLRERIAAKVRTGRLRLHLSTVRDLNSIFQEMYVQGMGSQRDVVYLR